jgi:hypothetical protein
VPAKVTVAFFTSTLLNVVDVVPEVPEDPGEDPEDQKYRREISALVRGFVAPIFSCVTLFTVNLNERNMLLVVITVIGL